jgi:hypothetical protein
MMMMMMMMMCLFGQVQLSGDSQGCEIYSHKPCMFAHTLGMEGS